MSPEKFLQLLDVQIRVEREMRGRAEPESLTYAYHNGRVEALTEFLQIVRPCIGDAASEHFARMRAAAAGEPF